MGAREQGDSLRPASPGFASWSAFFRRCAERFSRLRILQQGQVHVYLAYIVLMVALALAWLSVRRWLPTS